MHGPDDPMHGTHTSVIRGVKAPCTNCYVTSSYSNLTYEDGSEANYDTGVMLHHAVLSDLSHIAGDVTCGYGQSLEYSFLGRRIFASGNERTGGHLPEGYGVKFGPLPLLGMLVELMNMKPEEQKVYVDVVTTYVPAGAQPMKEALPVWLDANPCSNSQHSVPEGESHTVKDWKSPFNAKILTVGGHVHDGGAGATVRNKETGKVYCESKAGYGTRPAFEGHIESMSVCSKDDLGTIRKGENFEIDGEYHTHHAMSDVMTIAIAYVRVTP
ncbi:hypothetical protein RKE29_17200 [Streptomyces sp. B1866]|uniref:hypothetical protein n=1 Tax=Streptomyces sp. B1866 TaxID=3075431 RepID=UPI00288F2D83|nr:hypothetical protein [Streptomyces sp. B1866]MDT3398362.1 hypothetical protein [Streptomyces sp. B1866]